jgi:hypothetical protein
MKSDTATWVALPVLLIWGCTAQPSATNETPTVVDSAGIEIVQYPAAAYKNLPEWTVSAEPEVRIGAIEGEEDYLFMRIAGALRLDDGRFAVLDGGLKQLRLFSANGEFLRSQGREGEGPGEYVNSLALWRLPGDSLAVFDASGGRVSVLTKELDLGRVVRVRPLGGNPLPAGNLHDGRLLARYNGFVSIPADLAEYWFISPQGADSLGLFRLWENIEIPPGGRLRETPPIWTQFRFSAAGGQVIYST